jgi:hypothetical protein
MVEKNDDASDISPSMLMAYADETLSPEDAARVEQAIAASADLRAEVEDYRISRRAVERALRPLDQLPVPPSLVDLILTHKGEPEKPSATFVNLADRRKARPIWIDALAAGVLLSAGLGAGGAFLGGGAAPASVFTMADSGALEPNSILAITLQSGASAVTRVRGAVQVRPIQTFMAGETPCREFEVLAGDTGSLGIACRREDGWRVETLVAANVTSDTGGFRLASGPQDALLESALAGLGASPGLDADAERCLIAAAWSAKSSCHVQ